jgi:replication factor A2
MDYDAGGNNYGGGGGFTSGGGDSYGNQGGGGSQGSFGAGGKGRKNYDDQRMIPVTCKMILSAQMSLDDGQQVTLQDGRPLTHVKLVGAVRSCEQNSTNIMYTIEDGTGLVEIKQWVDETACQAAQEMQQLTTQDKPQYVKIIATLKAFDQKITPVAESVKILSTGNELTHHFLNVVYAGEMAKQRDSYGHNPASPMMSHHPNGPGGVGFGGVGGGNTRGTPLMAAQGGGSDGIRNMILSYIHEYGGEFLYAT